VSAGSWSAGQLAAAALPVLAAFTVYLPALRNGFIWDDPLVLQQLRAIRSVGDLLIPPAIIPKFYFRPVIFVTYLIDRAIAGETPFWFHASVLAFHALNTLLVFLVARRLLGNGSLVPSLGALLFAVFPTHVESVAWMAGRSDVVVCTCMLLTLLLYIGQERAGTAWLAGAAFLLALLSKEMAIACLVLLPLLDLLAGRGLRPSRCAPLALATGIYFVLRRLALGAVVGGMSTGAGPVQLALDVVRAIGFYVARAVAPIQLCAYIPEVPAAPIYLVVGLLVPPLALACMAASWRRRHWQTAFLVAWFFVTLAPSLTVIVRRSASAVVADRYLYVPSVASCILLAWALVRLADRWRLARRWAAATIIALCVAFSVEAVVYTGIWSDNLAFWSDVAAKVPADSLPHRELASALLERGRLADAEHALQQALAGKSDIEGRAMTYNNLGNLYRRLRRYDDAERAFEAGLQIAPHPTLYHNLGMTLMARVEQAQAAGDQATVRRDIVAARAAFEQALRLGSAPNAAQTFLEWDGAKTHALLGQVLFSMGDRAGAREHLETSLRLQPTGPAADLTRRYLQQLPP
jgi:tetratricopeptide (TPR) repeat protein